VDVEWQMPRRLRTAALGCSDLFGGLGDSLGTDHFYQTDSRFVMDILELLWKLECVGAGIGYLWTDDFSRRTVRAKISSAF
jgi:hypothetical protein